MATGVGESLTAESGVGESGGGLEAGHQVLSS